MNKTLRYVVYSTLYIAILAIAIIFFWWFTGKPYTVEDFATPMPYIVIVGLSDTNVVYYADIDVPMSPKWTLLTMTGIGEISCSYGQLYTATATGSVPKYGPYDSSTQTSMAGGTVTSISLDDITNAVAGFNGAQAKFMYSATPTGTLVAAPGAPACKSVSLNAGKAYMVASDGTLQYSETPATGGWVVTNSETTWAQVCLDGGVIFARKNDGTVWYADRNIGNSGANITRITTPANVVFVSISLKGGRIMGISSNGLNGLNYGLYYSDSYSNASWKIIPLPTGVKFTKVRMMYPKLNARRKRLLGTATACNGNEEKIGTFCYQSCPSGRVATGTSCPYLAKHMNAIESCQSGEYINGGCFGECPANMTKNGEFCRGNGVPKDRRGPNASVTAQAYSCPTDGSVPGRYVRVRPTTLISNNKLCIAKIVVKDSAGNTLSRQGTSNAVDGTNKDAPIADGAGGWASPVYISGAIYDRESDGGKAKRGANLYWEVDLGSIQQISTIEFTGCSYQSTSGSGGSLSAGMENADQIKGMRIEVLYNSNLPHAAAMASRTLGSSTSQTITFNYTITDPVIKDRCFAPCPTINGVESMDQGDHTCVSASGGITERSVSTPIELSRPVCQPPTRPDGTIVSIPAEDKTTNTIKNIGNWVVDPSDSNFMLSCDVLPGSVLRPGSNEFPISPITYANFVPNLYGAICKPGVTNNACPLTAITFWRDIKTTKGFVSNTNSVCVKYNNITCAPGTLFDRSMDTCIIPSGSQVSIEAQTFDSDRFYAALVTYDSCVTDTGNGVVGAAGMIVNADITATCGNRPNERDYYGKKNVSQFLYNIIMGRGYDNYSEPQMTEGVNIAKPQRVASQCKCLNADGTVNMSASIYKGKCIKCPSAKEVFYAKGITTKNAWSQGNGRFSYTDGTRSIQPTRFRSLEDAKNTCESYPECTGITRYIEGTDTYYTMGIGALNTDPTYTNQSWTIRRGNTNTITVGDYTGQTLSDTDIPRAFADDYKSTNPKDPPTAITSPQDIGDLYSTGNALTLIDPITYLANLFGQATAAAMIKQSIERPDTYYSLVGTTRRLKANIASTRDNFGICVGPCDDKHPTHDPIQMIYDTVASPPLYVLYGTTCHDATQVFTNQPSIPAINTPASGNSCPPQDQGSGPPIVYQNVNKACMEACLNGPADQRLTCLDTCLTNADYCLAECLYGQVDNGDTCAKPDIPRPSAPPKYSCPTGTTLSGSICMYPCEKGDVLNGEFCEPAPNAVTAPILAGSGSSGIKCIKTSYGHQDPGGSSSVNKWLCDSQADLDSLLAGKSSTEPYVSANDLICLADDPTTGMYYCQSVADAKAKVYDTERQDILSSCDHLAKAYYDLSNNINIISTARTNALSAATQVNNIQNTLQGIYNSVCPGTTTSAYCTSLKSQLDRLRANINAGSSNRAAIIDPTQIAIDSRDKLVAQMDALQCYY